MRPSPSGRSQAEPGNEGPVYPAFSGFVEFSQRLALQKSDMLLIRVLGFNSGIVFLVFPGRLEVSTD
jgi:hypothetical protein